MVDPKIIARNYLKSNRLVIDVLASIPFDTFAGIILTESSTELQLFGLLKMIRIFRLGKIISHMRAREDIKMTFKLFQLLLFLIMYIHLIGCVWFLIVQSDESWIPPTDYIFLGTTLYEDSIWKQYWYSFYHSIFMMIGGEIGPRNVI